MKWDDGVCVAIKEQNDSSFSFSFSFSINKFLSFSIFRMSVE